MGASSGTNSASSEASSEQRPGANAIESTLCVCMFVCLLIWETLVCRWCKCSSEQRPRVARPVPGSAVVPPRVHPHGLHTNHGLVISHQIYSVGRLCRIR